MMEQKKLITSEEAAWLCGINLSDFNQIVNSDQGPPTKMVFGRVYVVREELYEWHRRGFDEWLTEEQVLERLDIDEATWNEARAEESIPCHAFWVWNEDGAEEELYDPELIDEWYAEVARQWGAEV